jgi:hypothetical protein
MSFGAALLRMSAPLVIWAVHFLVIYGLTAIACAHGFGATRVLGIDIVSWGIGAATVVAAGAMLFTIAAAVRHLRPQSNGTAAFVHWMSAAAGGLALVGVLWEAMPVLIVPVCG